MQSSLKKVRPLSQGSLDTIPESVKLRLYQHRELNPGFLKASSAALEKTIAKLLAAVDDLKVSSYNKSIEYRLQRLKEIKHSISESILEHRLDLVRLTNVRNTMAATTKEPQSLAAGHVSNGNLEREISEQSLASSNYTEDDAEEGAHESGASNRESYHSDNQVLDNVTLRRNFAITPGDEDSADIVTQALEIMKQHESLLARISELENTVSAHQSIDAEKDEKIGNLEEVKDALEQRIKVRDCAAESTIRNQEAEIKRLEDEVRAQKEKASEHKEIATTLVLKVKHYEETVLPYMDKQIVKDNHECIDQMARKIFNRLYPHLEPLLANAGHPSVNHDDDAGNSTNGHEANGNKSLEPDRFTGPGPPLRVERPNPLRMHPVRESQTDDSGRGGEEQGEEGTKGRVSRKTPSWMRFCVA